MIRIFFLTALCLLPLSAQADQTGLICTGEGLCIQSQGCGPNADQITVFVNPLGNPDEAIIHIEHESIDAKRTDDRAAFTFRAGEVLFSLQLFADNSRFALLGVDKDGQVNTYAGSCARIE